MPYHLELGSSGHSFNGKAIVVNSQTGEHKSNEPIPMEKAEAQMRVLEGVAAHESAPQAPKAKRIIKIKRPMPPKAPEPPKAPMADITEKSTRKEIAEGIRRLAGPQVSGLTIGSKKDLYEVYLRYKKKHMK